MSIFKRVKYIVVLALLALVTACGGGVVTNTKKYEVVFSGTVMGLQTGQSVTLLGALANTGQTLPITIFQNGSFNSKLVLPAGFDFTTAGTATVTISKQPLIGKCVVSFGITTSITVICTQNATAAGYYRGSQTVTGVTSSVNYAYLFIKNNGEYWLTTAIKNGSTATIQGLIYGSGNSSNGSYVSSSGLDIFSSGKSSATLRGSYVSGTSFDSISTISGVTSTGLLSVPSAASYSFIASPTLSLTTGNYNFSLANSTNVQSLTISITSTGALSGATASGCIVTGSITPMTTGENAYNISISYGASPCMTPNVINSGFATLEINGAGTQISGAALNSEKNDGLLFLGTKL